MNYRSNRAEKLIAEIEEEKESNKSKVIEAMDSLRKIIDKQQKVLLDNIENVEKDEKKPIEDYKRLLQGEQQSLIEQVLNFVVVCKDKQPKKRLEAKRPFEDYIRRTRLKLLELKPLTRTTNHIPGFEKIKEIEAQIRNMKLEKVPTYENPQLQQRIASNGTNTTLALNNSNLTDQDMEIVARMLETNRVRKHYFFLSF